MDSKYFNNTKDIFIYIIHVHGSIILCVCLFVQAYINYQANRKLLSI